MIKKYLIIFLMMSAFACSQKNNNDNININKTMDNSVNTIINNFKERPYYQIKVKSSGVNFDIRVNDLPIFRFFGKTGGTDMEYPINTAILHSGEQNLSLKVYPIKGEELILPNNVFILEVNRKDDAWVFDNKREVLLTMPKMIIPEKGLPYYEYIINFKSNVPYQLKGWEDSQKLTEKSEIQKKVETAYNKLKKTIEQKNNNEFVKLTERKISEEAISLFEKQDKSQNGFQEEQKTILPFNNCKIKFYGNGKLVRLENEDGESCFKGKTMENGKPVEYSYPILFHMPQNANDLEIIR